jgi:hypothetical protein
MSSIRRLSPGLASSITRSTSLEESAPVRKQQETAPVEPVRRGFSDQSDFQAHAPRYGYLLGTGVPPPGTRSRVGQGQAPGGLPASRLRAEHLARPTVRGATLEEAHGLAAPGAQVLLYPGSVELTRHAVVRHWDGHVTDPSAPTLRYPDTTAWERAHPGHERPTVLSLEDVELVLATPEGPERDELLAYFAPEGGAPVDGFEPARASGEDAGFMADLSDLPLPPAPEELLSLLEAGSDPGFVADLADAPSLPVDEPSVQVAADVGVEPLAVEVSEARGAVELQPERLAALAASESPEATQALLTQVGEDMEAFVRALLREPEPLAG